MKIKISPGFVVWLTGLPASGKTSLAQTMHGQLARQNIHTVILDSDELRVVLTPQPSYTAVERDWFYRVIVYLATLLADSGVHVLIAATANRRHYRDQARRQIERFAEVYVQCPLAVCRQRDPKGIYTLADTDEAQNVPGMGSIYEPPLAPEAAVDTSQNSPRDAADSIIRQLQGILSGEDQGGSS